MSLTMEQRKLLERLYNLKGNDSIIIKDINEKIIKNKEDFSVLSEESTKLEEEKDTFTTKRIDLDMQFSAFISEFEGMKSEKYAVLLEEANEEFDPEKMVFNVKATIPNRIEDIDSKIKNIEDEIDVTKKNISENEIESTELEGNLNDAKLMQERLVNLIEESLHGNGSITRDSVQELLTSLNFNEDDITELGKMILFPEGTLSAFDGSYKGELSTGKKIKDVLKNATEANSVTTKKDIIDPAIVLNIKKDDIKIEEKNEEPEENIEKPEERKETPSENKIENIAKRNIEFLKRLEINKEVIKKYETILINEELIEKLQFFIDNNKSAKDIELNFDILLAYTLEDLKNLKAICEDAAIDFKIIPLSLLKQGLGNFFANYEQLKIKKYLIAAEDLPKIIANLFVDEEIFRTNLDILTKYKLNLTKKNNKLAIQCLAKNPEELITGLDAIIEVGEDEIVRENPEKLSEDLYSIATKINYCKSNGVPIKSNNGSYYDFIFDDNEFLKIFDGIDLSSLPLPTKENMINSLSQITDQEAIKKLSEINNSSGYKNIKPNSEEDNIKLSEIINKLTAYQNGSQSYKINDYYLSKERVERNIQNMIINKISNNNQDILNISVLFDSIYNNDQMNLIIEKLNGGI